MKNLILVSVFFYSVSNNIFASPYISDQLQSLVHSYSENEKVLSDIHLLVTRLFPSSNTTPRFDSDSDVYEEKECGICLEEIEDHTQTLDCSDCESKFHFSPCAEEYLEKYVNHKDGYKCINPTCNTKIPISKLEHSQILKRRYLSYALSSPISSIITCFRCKDSVVVADFDAKGFSFKKSCSICNFSACHKCGSLHASFKCKNKKKNKNNKLTLADLSQLVSIYGAHNVGGCPACRQIIIKNEGCDSMVCGKNTEENFSENRFQFSGCGKKFEWEKRITPGKLKDYIEKPISCMRCIIF